MTTVLKKLLEQEPIKEPAKRWRNWYRLHETLSVVGEQTIIRAGEAFCTNGVYPSKEVAEAKHEDQAANPLHCTRLGVADFIGAFPEGERP